MNLRESKFSEFLKNSNITCFEREEVKDELETVVYRSFMEVEGQNLPMVIVMDNSIYTNIRVQIAPKVIKDSNREAVLSYINELNLEYKVFKYYVTEDADICLDSCITSIAEEFNPEMVYTILNVILEHITEHYSTFMKKIWSEEK